MNRVIALTLLALLIAPAAGEEPKPKKPRNRKHGRPR